jgi:hypothetical protein
VIVAGIWNVQFHETSPKICSSPLLVEFPGQPYSPKKQFLPTPVSTRKDTAFILQIRRWARFVWSLTPWSQEVLNVMARQE